MTQVVQIYGDNLEYYYIEAGRQGQGLCMYWVGLYFDQSNEPNYVGKMSKFYGTWSNKLGF